MADNASPLPLPSLRSFKVAWGVVTLLLSPEELAAQSAQRDGTPHGKLTPLLQAARTARARYADWLARWDDPVI